MSPETLSLIQAAALVTRRSEAIRRATREAMRRARICREWAEQVRAARLAHEVPTRPPSGSPAPE